MMGHTTTFKEQATSPQRRLWQRVLLQAVQDACGNPVACDPRDRDYATKRARVFLCASHSLSMVAHMAGFDPQHVRQWAMKQAWASDYRGGA